MSLRSTTRYRACILFAGVAVVTGFAAGACGGEALRADVPPLTVAPVRGYGALDGGGAAPSHVDRGDRDVLSNGLDGAPSPKPPPPTPEFGPGPLRPNDAHPLRMAVALRASRANASGRRILELLSALRGVADAKSRIGLDPFADGEWLLAYGSGVTTPWPNANVLKHTRPESAVASAIADAGFEPVGAGGDGGADAGSGAVWSSMFGVREVLLRPQAGVLALVPSDRAAELASALKAPIDLGVKGGELARVTAAEPGKLLKILPPDLVKGLVIVKPAADGGLDITGEADCATAERCAATAAELDELVRRQNSIMVRLVTRSVLNGLAIRADGTKLRATMHAREEQVEAIVGFARSQFDVVPSAGP